MGRVDAFGETGEVFDFGGGGELSARLDPFVEYRREVRPGGVDRSRIARRAAADDQTFYVFHRVFFVKLLSFDVFVFFDVARCESADDASVVVGKRPEPFAPNARTARVGVVIDDFVAGFDHVVSPFVDQAHALCGLDFGASFAEVGGPDELRRDNRSVFGIDEPVAGFVFHTNQLIGHLAHEQMSRKFGQRGVAGRFRVAKHLPLAALFAHELTQTFESFGVVSFAETGEMVPDGNQSSVGGDVEVAGFEIVPLRGRFLILHICG